MISFNLTTWNVLHRYHEEKYAPKSCVLAQYPKEQQRIKMQIEVLEKVLSKDNNSIICLQEVAGDLLDAIKKNFSNCTVFEYEHSRIPTPVSTVKEIYDNPREYLVTIVSNSLIDQLFFSPKSHNKKLETIKNKIKVVTHQFKTKGKAMIALVFEERFSVINTHVSFSYDGVNDMSDIYDNFIKSHNDHFNTKNIILCGDMNRSASRTVEFFWKKKLEGLITDIVDVDNLKPYSLPEKQHSLDCIIGFGKINFNNSVIACVDINKSSDHNPVSTSVNINNYINRTTVLSYLYDLNNKKTNNNK